MKPISVVLTSYNGSSRGYLKQSIESVLTQTYKDFELIIVDDGSIDDTSQICKKYSGDKRVKYIHQENKGPAAARNTGIKNAQFDYICFLDDDDLYVPDKLLKQVEFFSTHQDPNIGMIYAPMDAIDKTGKFLRTISHPSEGDIYERLFFGNIVTSTSSTMIKKEVFQKVGLFKEHFINCEDYELWLRIAKHYSVYSCDAPLVKYRVHQNSLSSNYEKMQFYHSYTLFLALQEAPPKIKAKKSQIYHRHHECCAAEYLGVGNFKEFQKQYKLYRMHGPAKLHWKIKYLLSYCPTLFNLLKQIR